MKCNLNKKYQRPYKNTAQRKEEEEKLRKALSDVITERLLKLSKEEEPEVALEDEPI